MLFFSSKVFSPDNYLRLRLVENNLKNKQHKEYPFLFYYFCSSLYKSVCVGVCVYGFILFYVGLVIINIK